jgi:hypothetical protein
MCQAPAYQPAGIAANFTQQASTSYTWRTGGLAGTTYLPTTCGGTRVINNALTMSCDNICSYRGGGNCVYPKVYFCPVNYNLSGTTCYPPIVTPIATPATMTYSCPAGSHVSGTVCITP